MPNCGQKFRTWGAKTNSTGTNLANAIKSSASSPKLRQILQRAQTVAPIPRPALITGEPGTGKELVAAAIHYGSDRKDRPFVKVNCAAIADQLLESELFGHEKGAYTGATEARTGKFEAASGGTLFLDEIGNTTPEFQQNVLRAIEYSEIQRVGSAAPIFVDVRVIAATNTDLETEIAEGRFRQDLYDRLRFEVLHMPPLRERREDIPALSRLFCRANRRGSTRPSKTRFFRCGNRTPDDI